MTPDDRIAQELMDAMDDAGYEAFSLIVAQIVTMSKADVPVGDPAVDPHPEISLRESFHVRWFDKFVTIAVEAPYAVKQHEALHFKHPRGGRAKFLERHVAAAANDLQDQLTASVRTHLSGSGRTRVRAGAGLRT